MDAISIIPNDIYNNHKIKSYGILPVTGDILSNEYHRFVRQPHADDVPPDSKGGPLYFGEWEEVTELDQAEERVKRAKKELLLAAIAQKRAEKELKNN